MNFDPRESTTTVQAGTAFVATSGTYSYNAKGFEGFTKWSNVYQASNLGSFSYSGDKSNVISLCAVSDNYYSTFTANWQSSRARYRGNTYDYLPDGRDTATVWSTKYKSTKVTDPDTGESTTTYSIDWTGFRCYNSYAYKTVELMASEKSSAINTAFTVANTQGCFVTTTITVESTDYNVPLWNNLPASLAPAAE